MIRTILELRSIAQDVIKIAEVTDPNKTEGKRLFALVEDILDTVDDLVLQQGLSISNEMQEQRDAIYSRMDSDVSSVNQAMQDYVLAHMPDLGGYALLNQLPNLSGYQLISNAFSGSYLSLTNTPSTFIPTSHIHNISDITGLGIILTNKQNISDSIEFTRVINVPALFDGNYNSLSNKPAIPSNQVNSDWNSVSGVSQILNKPAIFDGTYNSLSGKPTLFNGSYLSLSNIPTTFTPTAHTHIIGNITGLQTVLDTITKYYNPSGIISQNIKKWSTIIVPTTASGFVIDISSAGFTAILGVQCQAERNTAVASDVVQVGLKTKSTTSLSFNLTQTNTATVSVVGINVLSGLPLIFATNLTSILLHVEVTGY